MSIAESKITAQGQISIPAKIRAALGVSPGSILQWHDRNGEIVVTRAAKYSSEQIHRAVFSDPPKAQSVATMDEGIKQRMQQKHARR